jgi:hypothetical protein
MTAPWASGPETYRCQLKRIDILSYGPCPSVIGNPSVLREWHPRAMVAHHRHDQIRLRMSSSASASRIKPSSLATST